MTLRQWCAGAVLAGMAASGCALRRDAGGDYGIPPCPAEAAGDLLSPFALQCWFEAPRGRWRTLSLDRHLEALVVVVEADDHRDADSIARRFAAGLSGTFAEILVYTQQERSRRVRRVRWTRGGALDSLDYVR